MTVWDLFTIAIQRWALTLTGLLLTAVAMVWVTAVSPVYFEQVRVVILPPAAAELNGLADSTPSLINLAGIAARKIQGSADGAQAVSSGVTLAGEGVQEGFAVRHANSGGQWRYRFDEPVLDVQAVGGTSAEVNRQMGMALARVDSALTTLQDEQGVAEANRVRTILNPQSPQLTAFAGNHTRAAIATALIGLIGTFALLGALGPRQRDRARWLRRRGSDRRSGRAVRSAGGE